VKRTSYEALHYAVLQTEKNYNLPKL